MIRRFFAILWKEWKCLQPFYFLLLALFVVGLLVVQALEFMDEYPIWDALAEATGFSVGQTFVLCIVGVLGLLTREKDEGILTYLDGLPVSRFSMYLAKWLLVVILVFMLDAAWMIEGLVYEYLSKESDSQPTPWQHLGTYLFLHTFLIGYFVSILMPISFLRFWSLLVIPAGWMILSILETIGTPYITWINPFALIQLPEKIDDPWVIPWKHMAILSIIGGFAWFIGLCFYGMMSAISGRKSREFMQSSWGKALTGLGIFGGLLILAGLFVGLSYSMVQNDALPLETVPISGADLREPLEDENAIESAISEKFQFVYRRKMAQRIAPLLKEADDIFNQVAQFLQAPPPATAGRVVVDFSSPLGSHNAGQAYWKKIRMSFPEELQLAEARAILGHEVTHVLINNLTNTRLEESFGSARWFHEGLASYVEFTIFRGKNASQDYDHWLALSSTWGEVHFEEMVSNGLMIKNRDPNIAYPAGMECIKAAIDVYGEEFPAKILTSIGRPDAPRKLEGLELWRDACLAAGYDLERIRGRFRARLKDLREEHKATCESMPEITKGKVIRQDGQIVITPELPEGWQDKAPTDATLICRVRPDDFAEPGKWRYSKLLDDNTFAVSALDFLKPRLSFQVGWRNKNWCETQPIFGQWVEAPLEP